MARDGRVLFEKAYGLANRELGVPNKLETKFRLGSVTKQFTAMSVERDRERERKAAEAARQLDIERKRAELTEVLGTVPMH